MDTSDSGSRLIFVGGSPRSGTTLLQNILDSHPDVLGGPEFLHLPDIIELREKLHDSVSRDWISLFCSHDDVDTQIRVLITNFLIPFADKHGGKYLSEKTPENILVFPKLVELFPESRFIQIVRDPRAIVASLLNVGKKARDKGETPALFAANVQSAINYVKRCLNAGFGAAHSAPDKIYTLVYERLVHDPEHEGRKLCEFLGIEWHPSMSQPAAKKHLGESAITVNSKEIWYDSASYNTNPNTDSVDRWRKTLRPYQLVAIRRAFQSSEDLKQLGYDFSDDSLDTKNRVVGTAIFNFVRLKTRIFSELRRILRARM